MERLPYANKRSFCALELEELFPQRAVPTTVYRAEACYSADLSLPATVGSGVKIVPNTIVEDEQVTSGEVDPVAGVDVRVVLMNFSKVPTRFTTFWAKLVMCSGTRNGAVTAFYGGNHIADDGDDVTSMQTLVNTAVRHLKAQSGLDLSDLPLSCWHKVATYHQRSNPARDPVAPTTIHLIPFYWEAGTDSLDVAPVEYIKRTVNVKKTKKTIEEEVEEEYEVEQEAPDQEGVTEDEKVMEKVKKVRTKTVSREVEEEEEEEVLSNVPLFYPVEASLHAVSKKKRDASVAGYTADFISDWISFRAAAEVAQALEGLQGKKQEVADRKRKREEVIEVNKRRKKEVLDSRDAELATKIAEMQSAWKEDDEGKTEDELKESVAERQIEQKQLKETLKKQWAEQDSTDVEMAVPEAEVETTAEAKDGNVLINQPLLTACSLFDSSIVSLGALPTETIPLNVLRSIVGAYTEHKSDAAITDFVCVSTGSSTQPKSFQYRVLTDEM